jgi:hypothetical protein
MTTRFLVVFFEFEQVIHPNSKDSFSWVIRIYSPIPFYKVVNSKMIVTLVLEENANKTLDVQALHKAIDQTLEQLKHQSDEIAKVQKSVEEIASLMML